MQLKNQPINQNLTSEINKFAKEIQKTGKTPEQLYKEVVNSGKYSKEQIEAAINKAKPLMKLLGFTQTAN